ncbi:hypothetical protein [Bradyrhizobium sp. CB2312]|uniref:hypothetical protein n=1 Tax=Bradyrhizobium sp. CB2312 TaxID=3039155 RepID=UPI0024B1C6C2|nr:hypothetical protein [Bradyrhizobium sp. CB2312]WFU73890.1 hypothetical protein QA642_07465 [Bradyrhizobium sp. CB2312]
MGTLTFEERAEEYQWASDTAFDGIRLEVLSSGGDVLFDVSVPDRGPITVDTFGKDVAANLLMVAIEVAQRPR